MNSLIRQFNIFNISKNINLLGITSTSNFHTSESRETKWNKYNNGPRRWLEYNKKVFPPQLDPNEESRKAYVCHMKTNIKYSPKKMWYIASLIRGMTVDEALKQLSFVLKKAAKDIREVILEAQEMAVNRHNVEFKSNLWIAESNVGKGRVFKGVRRHARGRTGEVRYKYCHYFLRLEEGTPPKNYYLPEPQTPVQQLDTWLSNMRKRKVIKSL